MNKEFIEELNNLEENLTPESCPELLYWDIDGGDFCGLTFKQNIDIEIPEGVKNIKRGINWVFYSTMPGTGGSYATKVRKVILPSSLEKMDGYLFNIQPQYDITVEFKGDVMQILRNRSNFDALSERIVKSRDRLEALKQVVCTQLLWASARRTEVIFDVEPDLSDFESDEIDFVNL